MVKYCHNCGNKIEDNEHFCSKCGQKAIELNKDYIQRMEEENKSNKTLYDTNSSRNINSSNSNSNINNKPATPTPTTTNSNQNINTNSSTGVNSKKTVKKKGTNGFFCKTLLILFIVCILISGIYTIMEHRDTSDSYVPADTGKYTIDIENGSYLGGNGSSRLIDSDYSTMESNENYTITGYETYNISLSDGNWYLIDLFAIDYNSPAKDWVYNAEDDDGYVYIFYNTKGRYNGYFVNIPDSSDNSTYQSLSFLESIFHKGFDY